MVSLTKESAFTIDDLTMIRKGFQDLLAAQIQDGNHSVKMQDLRATFSTTNPSLQRAFQELMNLIPEDQQNKELTKETFSHYISDIELLMIKKYCLRNYLDSYKEVINDFVVSYDSSKTRDKAKAEKSKKARDDAVTEQEFIGKIKAFRDLEYINIKNPEYVLSLLAEDMFTNIAKKTDDPNDIEGMKNILNSAN